MDHEGLESSILRQIAAGDQAAVARCLDTYGGLVWHIASVYLGGRNAEVEDAVQDVFITIWRAAARFDPRQGSERAYVATIARRRVLDARRRLAVRSPDRLRLGGFHDAGERAPAPTSDELAALGEEFARLPDDERLALWFAVSKGLSHREIAQATSVPIGTVKSRLRRAVLRLQRAFRDAPAAPIS